METINSDKNRKKLGIQYLSILIIAVFSLALSASVVHAQPYVETVKHRNLTIDLGNGLTTNAQLTIPAIGKGPFPGVIIFPGADASPVISPTSIYSHMADYLSDRGFAVLTYEKRGVGPNFIISDSNAWGNLTFNNL